MPRIEPSMDWVDFSSPSGLKGPCVGESEGPGDQAGRQAMTHTVSRHQCRGRLSTFSEKKTHSELNSQPTCPSHPQCLSRKISASASHDLLLQEGGGTRVQEGRGRGREMERNGLLFCHPP